jgi:hypothetical protein
MSLLYGMPLGGKSVHPSHSANGSLATYLLAQGKEYTCKQWNLTARELMEYCGIEMVMNTTPYAQNIT